MNEHSTINLVKRLNNGENIKSLEKEIESVGRKRAKEKGKRWGRCDACDNITVLEATTGLCGPCCFGEADTFNGDF